MGAKGRSPPLDCSQNLLPDNFGASNYIKINSSRGFAHFELSTFNSCENIKATQNAENVVVSGN